MHLSDAQTIPQLLISMAERGDHPAVVSGDTAVTYADLSSRITEASRAYLAHGIQPGDRICLWSPNRLEFIAAMLGAQAVGAAVVPLNTRYTGHEAAMILRRSGAAALVVANKFLGRRPLAALSAAAADAADLPETAEAPDGRALPVPGLPALRLVIDLDGDGEPETTELTSWNSFLASGAGIGADRCAEALNAVKPDDVVDILYTSGTTGLPKGVMSAQRQTLGVARAWAAGADLCPEDRYAVVNPFFHGFGYKAGMVASLLAGATIYPVETFDASQLLELIQAERISVLPGVPTIFTSLLNHPDLAAYDTSSLRFAIAGAAAAPETLFRDMVEVLGFRRVAQAYGLTECVVATLSRPGESLEHAKQTTGPAVAGTEIRIVDAGNRELPIGEDGEILLRGDNVMLGYFEDPEATRNAVDGGGWFHTGDIGRLDEHGCLKITDRLKDMFIVGGFNVYPAEIENVLRQHPAVNESAVVGIDDTRMGSVGRAYVALLQDADPMPTADDLLAFCKTRLANYKLPREYVIVNEFPRNGTGKIMKSELRGLEPSAG